MKVNLKAYNDFFPRQIFHSKIIAFKIFYFLKVPAAGLAKPRYKAELMRYAYIVRF
jgi:hypothetical protein